MDTKTLTMIRMKGIQVREIYKNKGADNSLSSLIFKILNVVNSNNKYDFLFIVETLFNNCGINFPSAFIEILADDNDDFKDIGFTFISGLIDDKSVKENNTVKEG